MRDEKKRNTNREFLSHSQLKKEEKSSCGEDADTTSLLDSLFSNLGEQLCLHNNGDLGESSLAEHLEVTLIKDDI